MSRVHAHTTRRGPVSAKFQCDLMIARSDVGQPQRRKADEPAVHDDARAARTRVYIDCAACGGARHGWRRFQARRERDIKRADGRRRANRHTLGAWDVAGTSHTHGVRAGRQAVRHDRGLAEVPAVNRHKRAGRLRSHDKAASGDSRPGVTCGRRLDGSPSAGRPAAAPERGRCRCGARRVRLGKGRGLGLNRRPGRR